MNVLVVVGYSNWEAQKANKEDVESIGNAIEAYITNGDKVCIVNTLGKMKKPPNNDICTELEHMSRKELSRLSEDIPDKTRKFVKDKLERMLNSTHRRTLASDLEELDELGDGDYSGGLYTYDGKTVKVKDTISAMELGCSFVSLNENSVFALEIAQGAHYDNSYECGSQLDAICLLIEDIDGPEPFQVEVTGLSDDVISSVGVIKLLGHNVKFHSSFANAGEKMVKWAGSLV